MEEFRTALYVWYRENQRDLPWRQTSDPYLIWISEIILQQTRVAQGISYYQRFIEKFPTTRHLAEAHEDEVLKLWQGLGYYSRARNLHHTAKQIMAEYNGQFPETYQKIAGLKGIGPYTAAAITSIAFGLPYAAVDGNIYRVLARYFGISTPIDSTMGKKKFHQLADELLDRNDPGMFNQAMMEFGALQCIPKSPDCQRCPVNDSCFAFSKNQVGTLPVKTKKTKQRHRYFYYYLIDDGDHILLEKRNASDIWKNLYQLPLLETDQLLSTEDILKTEVGFLSGQDYNVVSVTPQKKHVLSHQIIHARVILTEISKLDPIRKPLIRVNKKDISKFAVPRLLELFLEEMNFDV